MSATATEVSEEVAVSNEVSTQIESRVEEIGADVILGEVKKNCFIVYVTVRAWTGHYMNRSATVQLEGQKVDEELTTNPQWKLLPKTWHNKLQKFESRARKLVSQCAVPFKDGVYMVPKSKAKALADGIKAIRVEYMTEVARLAVEWPTEVRALQKRITDKFGMDQWLTVSKLIPDARQLVKMYDIEIGLWPIGGGGIPVECFDDVEHLARTIDAVDRLSNSSYLTDDDRVLLRKVVKSTRDMTDKVKRNAGKLIEENAEEWMGEAQNATNKLVAAAIETMLTGPQREFAEAVQNLVDLQARDGTCRAGTLDIIRRAYQKLQGFSFMMPDDLMERLRGVEIRLGAIDPQAMNGRSVAAEQLTESLRAISDEMNDDAAQLRAFGQFARNLDI